MSAGMEAVRERMAEYLKDRGVDAVTAWPEGERVSRKRPAAVVSLRECRAGPAGFQNYLGERYSEETGLWEELYGRKAVLIFGLDLYASKGGDGSELQKAFDVLARALADGGPEGMKVTEFSCGETEYDGAAGVLKRSARAVCQAWLYASVLPGGLFNDFELRGGLKQ